MGSHLDLETYCFTDDISPYAESFKGKRPYALLLKGKEFQVKDWNDFVKYISVLLQNRAPEWLNQNALRYGWFYLMGTWFIPKVTNAFSAIKKTRSMLSEADVPLADVSVVYGERNSTARGRMAMLSDGNESGSEPVSEELEKLRAVFSKFASGVRAGSVIDQNRLRRGYAELYGEELRQDFDFKNELKKIGFEYEGKIFPRSGTAKKECLDFIRSLISDGNRIFNFSRVMELQSPKLMSCGVHSADMLMKVIGPHALHVSVRNGHEEVLARPNGELLCKIYRNWFAPVDGSFDLGAIVIGDLNDGDVFVSENLLFDKYKYVEPELIHRVLTSGTSFVWNEDRDYVVSERVEFDESEVESVRQTVIGAVASDGYYSLAHIDLPESLSMNDSRLTMFALRKIFVERFLVEYTMHGQIICKRGSEVDAIVPLREFCNRNSEVTLQQLETVMAEYNIHGGYGLAKVKELMVRVDEDRFVSPEIIAFDVQGIDDAIQSVWMGHAMGLGEFVNFSSFPSVPGYSWTPYLFESYLRRESEKFGLLNPRAGVDGAKKRNAGAVVKVVDRDRDVYEVFAIAAVDAGVDANPDNIGDFLFDKAFISNRSTKTIQKVLDYMQVIYEGKKRS